MKGVIVPRLAGSCAQFVAMGGRGRLPGVALLVLAAVAALGGCASSTRAPVIDRARALGTPSKYHAGKSGDWRPATYMVKNGDTLWSIALEFGLDYRDLAAWNGIGSSYAIQAGQRLRLKPPRQTTVLTTPLKTEAPVAARATFIKSQPRAVKLPSSKRMPPKGRTNAGSLASGAGKAGGSRVAVNGNGPVAWGWPAQGKIVGRFNDAKGAKGIDIAGKMGEPVFAAAAGKVVYSGSGLRGYGKLIIIKHNRTYLSAYAHNSRLLVKEGQGVVKGQEIAKMGDSGSSRVELHFEIRQLGRPVDPLKYLPNNGHL